MNKRIINLDEVVVYGAAVQAAIRRGAKDKKLENILSLGVVPLSVGLETAGGVMEVLIPRNSAIPFSTRKSKVFTTYADNQPDLSIRVFEGERSMTRDNNLLGYFELTEIPPAPRGKPQIEVTIYYNVNHFLEVIAKDITTGKSINVKSYPGLSEEDVEKMKIFAKLFEEKKLIDKRGDQKIRKEDVQQLDDDGSIIKIIEENLMKCEKLKSWTLKV